LPTITDNGTGTVVVEVIDSDSGDTISEFTVESRHMAERYVRSQVAVHDALHAALSVNARNAFAKPEFYIDGDEYDGEVYL
jgi:hypothetical protein